jgi:hypothetical protein
VKNQRMERELIYIPDSSVIQANASSEVSPPRLRVNLLTKSNKEEV